MLCTIRKAIEHPEKIVLNLGKRGFFNWMSDEGYIRLVYKLFFGQELNLDQPITFSEKLQWLKLYDRNPFYIQLVDKYEVKKYISDKIGEKYVIPTIDVWDSVDDIDFDSLPNQFVLKCTHDSGGLIVCPDKTKLDISKAKEKLSKSLKRNFYYFGREWPYKNVKPRIIAERFMKDTKTQDLWDYKFYCFNGKPLYCQVITNRSTNEAIDFFDETWKLQEFVGLTNDVHNSAVTPEKPLCYEQMHKIAEKLSEGMPFIRVDLYEINGEVYFGELTFYPYSGFGTFTPAQWNVKLGELISLPTINKLKKGKK